MNELKQTIIEQAISRYQTILPIPSAHDLTDCFTIDDKVLYFWFNTRDNSTHVISAPIVG